MLTPRVRLRDRARVKSYIDKQIRQAQKLKSGRSGNAFIGNINPRSEESTSFSKRQIGRLVTGNELRKHVGHGTTAAVKDNFTSDHFPTTCASKILQDFQGPPATVTELLKNAGVSIVGKANMDEFGMGSHSINSAYGPVYHGSDFAPFSAGGSSGGSAVAVANDVVDFALGSDTGGSVRLPAAYTRIVGFKPSYGRISRYGLVPYANSLDTVGILAGSCELVGSVFDLLDQPDHKDPTCLNEQARTRILQTCEERLTVKHKYEGTYESQMSEDRASQPALEHYRIGVPVEYNITEMSPVVRRGWIQSILQLRELGHTVVPISLPSTKEALSAYYILAPAEASSNLAKYDGVRYGAARDENETDDEGGTLYARYRGNKFGDEVKHRILLGSYTLSAGAIDNYFIQAQKVRRLVQHDFNLIFRMAHPLLSTSEHRADGVDFIICPTAPTPPPRLAAAKQHDPLRLYMNDVFTVPASLAGLPALSVPAPTIHGGFRPLEQAAGIQIIGQFGDDRGVLRFANDNFFWTAGSAWENMRYTDPGSWRSRSKIY